MTNKEIEVQRDFNYNLKPKDNRIREIDQRGVFEANKIPYIPRNKDK